MSSRRRAVRRRRRARGTPLALVAWGIAGAVAGQEPPLPDTILPDTIVRDTVPADTVPPVELPRIRVGPPAGWATSTWTFDRDALMGLRDLTLLELLEEIPGVVALRGGDYGAPEAASALGMGGGRIRVFWDGFEMTPLDGAAPDLAMIGLGGLEEVRVQRGPGELRIHVESLRSRDVRPFSLVEAGTGDTDTNFFRGTFLHPDVLGGILGFALERLDTRGPFRREPGHRLGGWASWGRSLGDNFGVRLEARRMSRDVRVPAFAVGFERNDWVLRGRGRFLQDRLTTEVFTGRSSLESRADEGIVPVDRGRRQHGLRALWETGPAWGSATLRLLGGPRMPSRSLELEGGGTLERIGGAHGRWSLEAWPDRDASAFSVHAWTAPVGGLSGFAAYASGVRGAVIHPPYEPLPPDGGPLPPDDEEPSEPFPEEPPPGSRYTDRSTARVGASFQWRPLTLEGAWLRVEADSLPPLGLVLDREGPVAPGGSFTGWEARLGLRLPVEGFVLNGALQSWDREARYLPARLYQASIDFHDVFLETRNLELWGAVGVKGRDPMLVPRFEAPEEEEPPSLARVPFYQSWYLDIQVRVLPVHVFIRWENFVLRQNLQDFPGRRLPVTRAIYGVKWILWN